MHPSLLSPFSRKIKKKKGEKRAFLPLLCSIFSFYISARLIYLLQTALCSLAFRRRNNFLNKNRKETFARDISSRTFLVNLGGKRSSRIRRFNSRVLINVVARCFPKTLNFSSLSTIQTTLSEVKRLKLFVGNLFTRNDSSRRCLLSFKFTDQSVLRSWCRDFYRKTRK